MRRQREMEGSDIRKQCETDVNKEIRATASDNVDTDRRNYFTVSYYDLSSHCALSIVGERIKEGRNREARHTEDGDEHQEDS